MKDHYNLQLNIYFKRFDPLPKNVPNILHIDRVPDLLKGSHPDNEKLKGGIGFGLFRSKLLNDPLDRAFDNGRRIE